MALNGDADVDWEILMSPSKLPHRVRISFSVDSGMNFSRCSPPDSRIKYGPRGGFRVKMTEYSCWDQVSNSEKLWRILLFCSESHQVFHLYQWSHLPHFWPNHISGRLASSARSLWWRSWRWEEDDYEMKMRKSFEILSAWLCAKTSTLNLIIMATLILVFYSLAASPKFKTLLSWNQLSWHDHHLLAVIRSGNICIWNHEFILTPFSRLRIILLSNVPSFLPLSFG